MHGEPDAWMNNWTIWVILYNCIPTTVQVKLEPFDYVSLRQYFMILIVPFDSTVNDAPMMITWYLLSSYMVMVPFRATQSLLILFLKKQKN